MTAANIFARADGTWMFFDTSIFDDDGFIRRFGSKVGACDRLRMAIGACGRVPSDLLAHLACYFEARSTQAEAIADLPGLVRTLSAAEAGLGEYRSSWWRRAIWGAKQPRSTSGITLLVGWWDMEAARGRAAFVSDVDDLGPKYPPLTVHAAETFTSPRPDFGEWFDWHDDLSAGLDFQPARDGAKLAELERGQPKAPGAYRVGGSFERYHIHANGVDREIVATWPDQVGRPIKLAA